MRQGNKNSLTRELVDGAGRGEQDATWKLPIGQLKRTANKNTPRGDEEATWHLFISHTANMNLPDEATSLRSTASTKSRVSSV